MSLKLMYITNRADVAKIAEICGVDRIFVDMEFIGKEERQPGDTVKSSHTLSDVKTVRGALCKSELLVRVNPMVDDRRGYCSAAEEIDGVVAAGADVIMLPMAKNVDDVRRFAECVRGRAKTILLLETAEAADKIDEILSLGVIDEVHIGLNDLHLSLGRKFMFELLVDGTVEKLCQKIAAHGLPYGFGGIARIGYGMLPSEYIIAEHYRLGSSAAILSRSFANVNNVTDIDEIAEIFKLETANIRCFEQKLEKYSAEEFEKNKALTAELVREICERIEE